MDARFATLLTLEIGATDERGQIAIARIVHAQQRDARRLDFFSGFGDEQIDADDGLHAAPERSAIELHHREQIALIGDRDRRHPAFGHLFDERRDAHHAVDQRIFGVQAQVDEGSHTRDFTGPKLRRCADEMPFARSAARCAAVG